MGPRFREDDGSNLEIPGKTKSTKDPINLAFCTLGNAGAFCFYGKGTREEIARKHADAIVRMGVKPTHNLRIRGHKPG